MNRIIKAAAVIAALSPGMASAQVPQFPQNLPGSTVVGRLGTQTGPSQAIPFATLSAQLSGAFGPIAANLVNAGPASGAAATATFRALVGADLPVPGASSLGGVKSLTCSASNWFNTLSTAGALGCSQPNFTDLAGSIAAGQIPAGVVALTKLATQAANTVVANATGGSASPTAITQTQLTALINTATASLPGALPAWPNNTTSYFRGDATYATHNCASNTDASVYCSAARGQLPGETSTGSATAGNIGEYVESNIVVGSAVSLTTATSKDVTTISLTAGDWDVSGSCSFVLAASTSITFTACSASQTLNTLDTTNGRQAAISYPAFVPTAGTDFAIPTIPLRFSLSGTTTIHLVANSTFTVSTNSAFGIIRARRIR